MLSLELKGYIKAGDMKRKALLTATSECAMRTQIAIEDDIRDGHRIDTILMGTTGIGKTEWIRRALKAANVPHIKIRGSVSFLTLCANLMLAHHQFKKKKTDAQQKMVVVIDDCDTPFQTEEGRNALKEMTEKFGETRKLSYNRIIQEHLLRPDHLEILDLYRPKDGGVGFQVDCNDFIFIISTNFMIPTENDANVYAAKNPASPGANKRLSLAAIRRRFTVRDFILPKHINWGWLAHVALSDETLVKNILGAKLYKSHINDILYWMWINWEQMTEHNLDTVKSLAYAVKENPEDFIDRWESEFIDGMKMSIYA